MSGRVSVGGAARLLCAAATLPFASAAIAQPASVPPSPPAQAPPPDAAELDPSAPMAPMPGLGVEWPDLNAREQAAPNTQATVPSADKGGSETRYIWALEGIAGVGNFEELLKAFRQQSALEADRKDAANAA